MSEENSNEIIDTCNQCDDPIKFFSPDSKCCDQKICKDCLEFSDTCENCEASLCENCSSLTCQACSEDGEHAYMCRKCCRSCVYCNRDYCSNHLLMEVVQMQPCKTCSKQPCLDKSHPKESYNYVLACMECRLEETKKARKRKRFFASVLIKKSKQEDATSTEK